MTIDETEMIEFFGVLPTQQDPQEQEFFGSTAFEVSQNDHHLSVSFSSHFRDFCLSLRANNFQEPVLEFWLEEVEEIRVRRDKPDSIPALIVKATEKDEKREIRKVTHLVEIVLQPNLRVKLSNRSET